MIQYRNLHADELNRELLKDFIRHQKVEKCWRKEDGQWLIRDDPFTDDWTEEDYETLIFCLKNTLKTGGFVYGAFQGEKLKGFVSAEALFFLSATVYSKQRWKNAINCRQNQLPE